ISRSATAAYKPSRSSKCWNTDRTDTPARSAMRGAVGRKSPSSTSAIEASTIDSRVRSARAVRPSMPIGEIVESDAMGLLDLSDRILRGEAAITDHHPFAPSNELEEVGSGVAFVQSFANV